MFNFGKKVEDYDNNELVEIMNLEGHNGEIQQFRHDAVDELRERGAEPIVTGKDTDGYNVYGLRKDETK